MSATEILNQLIPKKHEEGLGWTLPVDRNLCLGPPQSKHMSGGACTAAMIDAMEQEIGKPVIQAATQFLSSPKAEEIASISVKVGKTGRSICQAQASLSVGSETAATLSATLGVKRDIGSFAWAKFENADTPSNCPRIPFVREDEGDLHSHLDMRLVETPSGGDMRFWVKTPDNFPEKPSAFLALVADYLPEAIHFNIGRSAGAVSLDNSVRIVGREATDWLLCHTQLLSISDGIFHGQMNLFADNGSLLATASQSGVVRLLA
ncbi:acyl-CoA thioesterase domain-containing protein [Sphingorhabdus sp. Alg231-15]|uniref:acyl-CoA thioesterase domain-containing protein n=1 Tax=Sphingorhabdus sp. Alg231-15 TaxID=1922222 RepID=UPI000D550F41